MTDLRNMKCVVCRQTEATMLVFVGTLRYEDGTIGGLPEGAHPYCESCRKKLYISDELNAGRDLQAEAKQATLNAVTEAQKAGNREGSASSWKPLILGSGAPTESSR